MPPAHPPGQEEEAAPEQRALQPRIGEDVYAGGTRLGRVERVIVSPRHRGVVAFVVRTGAADEEAEGTRDVRETCRVIPIASSAIPSRGLSRDRP